MGGEVQAPLGECPYSGLEKGMGTLDLITDSNVQPHSLEQAWAPFCALNGNLDTGWAVIML